MLCIFHQCYKRRIRLTLCCCTAAICQLHRTRQMQQLDPRLCGGDRSLWAQQSLISCRLASLSPILSISFYCNQTSARSSLKPCLLRFRLSSWSGWMVERLSVPWWSQSQHVHPCCVSALKPKKMMAKNVTQFWGATSRCILTHPNCHGNLKCYNICDHTRSVFYCCCEMKKKSNQAILRFFLLISHRVPWAY